MNGWLIFLILLSAYIAVVAVLGAKGILRKKGISLALGFIMMIRTKRGKAAVDRIARPKLFWEWYSNIGLAVCFAGMIAMFCLVMWNIKISLQIPVEAAPTPSMILALPGINPFIPVGFGILGLVIALVVHEGGHGILTRVAGVNLKSMGLLYAIVPIGAFVEPDEEELKKAPRLKRMRVFAAGPTANIAVALVCMAVFSAGFMGTLEPAASGLPVSYVVADSPAHENGVLPGSIITAIDDFEIGGIADFIERMNGTYAGQTISLKFFVKGEGTFEYPVTLADKYFHTNNTADAGKGFLGVGMGIPFYGGIVGHDTLLSVLEKPLSNLDYLRVYITLPLSRLSPMPAAYQAFYEAPGNDDAFWFGANCMYWVFWINLMVGLTNVLPAVPLDGGHMFRDALLAIGRRISPKSDEKKVGRIVGPIVTVFSLAVLVGILMSLIGPRIGSLF
ncbi:MAG: hypothetical protein CVT48_06315 [Thermoplasmata archaeon HGW-Thermoplasmata-1]|nr:MAG: hypothetical protein CVT48_06315 [Thermoplasmata archaeon HGW-Thermoplasmata-1]